MAEENQDAKKPTIFKSYVQIFTDEKIPHFLLVWNQHLDHGKGKYTYVGSSPTHSDKPLTKEEAARENYRFGQAALDAAEKKLGYESGLLRAGKHVVEELKDKEGMDVNQFAVLEFFKQDKPLSIKDVERMAGNYRKAHSDEPQPLVLTAAEIVKRDDVYHVIVESAKKGELLKKK
jgi:hypothetical protein